MQVTSWDRDIITDLRDSTDVFMRSEHTIQELNMSIWAYSNAMSATQEAVFNWHGM